MDLVSAPIEDQLAAFKQMVMTNAVVATLIERLPQLEVPGCYLAAGALYQTVWNCLCKRDPRAGINDYDINYFDATDLTWEAEDAVIRRGADLFGDLDATVEIRNEARVHVWYEDKFGVPCPAFSSTERTSSRNATERSERRQSCRRRRKHFRPSPADVVPPAPTANNRVPTAQSEPMQRKALRVIYETYVLFARRVPLYACRPSRRNLSGCSPLRGLQETRTNPS